MADESWEVLGRETVLRHPFLTVEMERVRLPGGGVIDDWPIVHARDYVNAAVLSQSGEMMVLEGYKHGLGRSSWQVVGGYIEEAEEPLAAIRRELLEETGYQSDDWELLGSFVVDANRRVGMGHFYLARNARQVAAPDHEDLEGFEVRWVTAAEAARSLRDGRVGVMSHAANIALALLALGASKSV